MTDTNGHGGPDELREALEAADGLISRLQERVGDVLASKGELDEKEAFYEIVEILETSQEITKVRMALNGDPHRWGEESATGSITHTG